MSQNVNESKINVAIDKGYRAYVKISYIYMELLYRQMYHVTGNLDLSDLSTYDNL